jgi:hypothetical protein
MIYAKYPAGMLLAFTGVITPVKGVTTQQLHKGST